MDSNKNKQSTETGQLLSAALDLGEQMLICGGEVNRVEDTICRLCKAYGAKKVDVFSITTCIIATADFGEQGVVTQTRRILESKFDMTVLSLFFTEHVFANATECVQNGTGKTS